MPDEVPSDGFAISARPIGTHAYWSRSWATWTSRPCRRPEPSWPRSRQPRRGT